ncbi:amylo-alpha-1,6-glucosidase [Brachybacterium sp. JHP9]|uniref:Amylo-alpha-1,6-glucosidase n=1 Tax=Brachybacterium equifaecis TaxID=2910770 RepID=A0ABT0R062_9MICO|nr:glycogen debranching N-terminal domain-containing protein [Brachybacterium equifaecis]MCL6423144.1 amylo-alpha-1,6-glucosidase [Brachybacterium equifaecis]
MNASASAPHPYPVQRHQPYVHYLAGVFHAPLQAWSRADGAMTGEGAQGIFLGDTRLLSSLQIEVPGADLAPMPLQVRSAREIVLRDVVAIAGAHVDPLLELHRERRADADGIRETVRLVSADAEARALEVRIALITDDAAMSAVKEPRLLAALSGERPAPSAGGDAAASWSFSRAGKATLRVGGGRIETDPSGEITLVMELAVPAGGGTAQAQWSLEASDPDLPFGPARGAWSPLAAAGQGDASADARESGADPERLAVSRLLDRSLADLDALRLAVPGAEDEEFLAAGAPWFFTLFGRDSLIAASLVLPLDAGLAASTLRTLARRQGTVKDIESAQQPGKILHEVRAQGIDMIESHLPPVYFGTIDATPLWIELLHDAWKGGMQAAEVAELAPHLAAAADWLLEHADADGDGFLEYIDESGHGLANQGWKDSGDSIRFADGTIAEGTIALCEVQGYAYAAALHAANLLEGPCAAAAESRPELVGALRSWASDLRDRFRAQFWCEDELGRFPALALDGAKRPVDGVASNMGHLLGTGILDADEEEIVVARLLDPSMMSGYGVRTLSTTNAAYWPLRYHGGSVWTHDTGYILRGMLRAGFEAEARILARALLSAANGFDQRLPELFSGQSADEVDPPLPYPASCRPQAWAAASAVPIAQALGVIANA